MALVFYRGRSTLGPEPPMLMLIDTLWSLSHGPPAEEA
jgi:hypothetical protein